MEKQFAVTISISIFPEADEPKCPTYERMTQLQPIAAFLYDIAGNGRRFKVESAGYHHATVSGACTEDDLSLLSEQMDNFFEIHGLNYGLSKWEIHRGKRIPEIREIFEDGTQESPQVSLVITFFKEWAEVQQIPPIQAFCKALQEKLCWKSFVLPDAVDAAHMEVLIHTDIPVWSIWEAGQSIFKEQNLSDYLVEFSVCVAAKVKEDAEENPKEYTVKGCDGW